MQRKHRARIGDRAISPRLASHSWNKIEITTTTIANIITIIIIICTARLISAPANWRLCIPALGRQLLASSSNSLAGRSKS